MPSQELMDLIATLSPDQQAVVEQFVQFLKDRNSPEPATFRAALDSFAREHSELLQRLAQ